MRLMPEPGQKTPAEIFANYKQKPWLIEEEINQLNATEEEKRILYNFMIQYGGVLDSQESLMVATMLPFTKYSVDEANVLRKIIAKKQVNKVTEAKEKFYSRGKELGTSKDILDYLWRGAEMQMGYSSK